MNKMNEKEFFESLRSKEVEENLKMWEHDEITDFPKCPFCREDLVPTYWEIEGERWIFMWGCSCDTTRALETQLMEEENESSR